MKEQVKLNIQAYRDREAIVVALANSGYKVSVREEKAEFCTESRKFYVIIDK